MKIPQSEKLWIGGGVAVAVVLAAGAWFGAIGPEFSHASTLHSKQADAESANEVLQHRTNKLRADNADLPNIVQQLQQNLQRIPVTADLDGYTEQLDKQAAASSVAISTINIGDPSMVGLGGTTSKATTANPSGHVFSFPITLTTDGPLAAQRALLNAIQRSGPRAALVQSVKFAPFGGTPSMDTATTMTTQLSIFVTPLSPAATAQLQTELGGNPAS